jgi:N-acetylglutamate synthase-like GNAT family acetyltransferase
MSNTQQIIYRRATIKDCSAIVSFVDFWLSGRARAQKIANAGDDYFVTKAQQLNYLRHCYVLLAEIDRQIVGWAVKESTNVLIHLLIDARYRNKGIGAEMLRRLNPDVIRSKSDQITGNPIAFYEKYDYVKVGNVKVGRKRNIDLMMKKLS